MLTVTDAARARLASKLASKSDITKDHAMRFVRRTGGYKLRLDRTAKADTTFTYDGKKVLVLDESVAESMKDMTLDARDSGKGPRLVLR